MNAPTFVPGYRQEGVSQATCWVLVALLLGSVMALAGLPVLYGVLALALVVVFASVVTHSPSLVMAASIWALALCPFSAGIETGVMPKLFADEMLLLLYLAVLAPVYWMSKRAWVPGFGRYLWLLAAFVLCQASSSIVGTDLIAFRNLLETFVLGPLLLVVFLQEAANNDSAETIARAVTWLAIVIAVLSVVEKVMQRNPLLESLELANGFQYLSPRIVAITEGTYRPYVTFFHPSETGTFMAMGLPYAMRHWRRERTWFSSLQIVLILAGLGVNATRGVWMGVAVALLLLAKKPLTLAFSALPVAGCGAGLAYLFLRSTPFMQRATDANNFMGRLIYWRLGLQMFSDHVLLGVGHMQFQKLYLSYVHEVSEMAQLSMTQIQVIDNIYLTTLVEHGLIGLLGLAAFLVGTGLLLKRFRASLLRAGLMRQGSLVQAAQLVLVIYAVAGFFADVNQFTKATKLLFILIGFTLGSAMRALRQVHTVNDVATDDVYAGTETAA